MISNTFTLVPSRRTQPIARALTGLVACFAITGCADSVPDKEAGDAPSLTGKADGNAWLTTAAALGFGTDLAVTGTFAGTSEFFGHAITVSGKATIDIEVTHKGTSSRLDTFLTVVGPLDAEGAWPRTKLGSDDDSGYGLHSKLTSLKLPAAGRYLAIVTTWNGTGRGKYRLEAACRGDGCVAPAVEPEGCRPEIATAIRTCHADRIADGEMDMSLIGSDDIIRECADPEIVAPAWDALCGAATRPAFCGSDLDDFSSNHLRLCRAELVNALLDAQCIFGTRYRDMFKRPGPLVIQWRRTLEAGDIGSLTALEAQQILAAVKQTAYDDVTTVAEAFEAVDEGLVNQTAIYDTSGRRAFIAYEVGAGDNSFGAWFAADSATPVALNNDGDVYECAIGWGPERRLCDSDEPCAEGLTCHGRAGGQGPGRCLDTKANAVPGDGANCTGDKDCASGLVCAGASGGGGLCNPAWMRGSFFSEPNISIDDAPATGTTASIHVFGLATVSTDVFVDVLITHPRISDLRVTLTNPDGTVGVIFEGDRAGTELYLRHQAVLAFPGDESINGTWTLTATDTVSGVTGQIVELGLELTSRWD